MKYLKYVDFYGGEFTLLINGSSKFKSVVGGILSAITISILIWVILDLGSDFIFRNNPYIKTDDKLFQNFSSLNVTDYPNKTLVFGIEKDVKKTAVLYAVQYYYNNGEYTNKKQNLKLCPKEYLINELKFYDEKSWEDNFNYLDYYCFNLNNYDIPTSSLGLKTIDEIVLTMDSCKNIESQMVDNLYVANMNDTYCEKAYYNKTIDRISFNIFFQKLGFSADSEDPFISKWSLLGFYFENNEIGIIKLPANYYKLVDDRGWLTNSIKTTNNLDFSTYKDNSERINEDCNVPYFRIEISLSENYKIYYRSYTKLQDFLAKIGGFMKLVLTILSLINRFISNYLIDRHINERLFIKSELEEQRNEMKSNLAEELKNTNLAFDNLFVNQNNKPSSSLKIKPNPKINQESQKESMQHLNKHTKFNLKILKSNDVTHFNKISVGKKTDFKLSSHESIYNNNNLFLEKENNSISEKQSVFNICEYYSTIISEFLCCSKDTSFIKHKLQHKINAFKKLKDYDYFLEKSIDVDLLKKVVFNQNQITLLKLADPSSISEELQFEKSNKTKDNILNTAKYLAELLKNDSLNPKSVKDMMILEIYGYK